MAFATTISDLEERVNVGRMQTYRRGRAKQYLKKYDLAGMLAFSPDNIHYLTIGPSAAGTSGTGNRYALFPVEGEPILMECGMWEENFAQENPTLDIRSMIPAFGWYESGLALNQAALESQRKKFAHQVVDILKEKKLLKERIGIDKNLPPSVMKILEAEGVKALHLQDGTKAISEARKIKNQDEVECLRITAAIVEACFAEVKRTIKPGVTEDDLMAVISYTAYRLGAEDMDIHVDTGRHTWTNMAYHSNTIIRPGDLVFLDVYNLSWLGYKSCYYRTFSCGEPSKAQRETFKQVRDWLRNGIAVIKPGVTTAEVAKCWPEAPSFGRPNEDAAILMQWGHGIGLTLYEPPCISRAWSFDYPEVFEKDMTVALETLGPTREITVECPLGQGVRIEDMIHVTDNGVEFLTRWPVDDIIVCPL
jgi:Xaa-Pro aminopeptidase